MEVVSERTKSFFLDELGISINQITYGKESVQKLKLRYLTSLLAVEGKIKLYWAFSFDESLITEAFKIYAQGIDVSEDERDDYIEETAGDFINIIIGNAVSQFGEKGLPINLSPPIIISEGKNIHRHRNGEFYTTVIETDFGKLDIYCIGSKEILNVDDAGISKLK